MKKILSSILFLIISIAAFAQVGPNDLIIQGSVTSTISTFPISNWPVTITGMGMTSTVYTDVNGFYSDTISNGSVLGPNQLFIVQTFDCDSSSITNTVSNNQGTVDVANLDFQICAQNLPCNADFSHSGPLLTNNSYQFIGLPNSDNAHHLWTFGDGASSEQEYPFHAYDTIGEYNVCHIVSIDGVCADTICITIQATENPACTAEIVTGYAPNGWPMFSAIGGSEIATYTWILSPYDSNGQGYGGSFFFSSQSNAYIPAGTLYAGVEGCLSVTFTNGCAWNGCANFTAPPDTSNTCMSMFNAFVDPTVAGQVVFQSTSSSSDTIASYNWTLDGISISNSPVFNFIFPSNNGGMVCLTITSSLGCSDTYCQYVTPGNNATCLPYFNYQASANNALDYTFTNTTTTTGTNPTYYWYFGDGANSSQASPTHVFNQAGTYSVCLQVITDQCQNTMCQNITVVNDTTSGNGCIANFTYVADSTTIQFSNNSYPLSQPVNFVWYFSDGTYSNEVSPFHTFDTTGVYQVCLDMTTGSCSDSYCLQVNVGVPDSNITCNASIQYSYVGDVPNPSMFPYQFYSAYSGDIAEVIHSWVTSDAQTSSSFSPLFAFAPGTYTVCHSVFDANALCSDSTCISIIVAPDTLNGCTAMFSHVLINQATNEFAFINASSDLNATFVWQFGDGSPSEFGLNATHTYSAPGSYPVNLSMTGNGCYDDYTFFVTINPDTVVGLYLGGVVSVGSNVIDMGSVKLYSLDTLSSSVELIGQYTMNNLGSYIFTNLSEGIYLVRAGLSDSSAYYNDYVPTYFGSQYYWFDAEPIYLTQSGDLYNISLIYGSNPGGNGTVNGSIDDGPFRLSNPALSTLMSPVLGAQVVITDLANVPQRWVRTDNSGAFSISDLAYGTYRLMADEPGMTCLPIEFTLSEQTPGVTIDLVMGDEITGILSYETSVVQGDVYPNPSKSLANLNIELMVPASLTMTMTSITGQVMWTQTNSFLQGKSSIQIPVRGIADGLYFLSIFSDKGQLITSRKMQVAN